MGEEDRGDRGNVWLSLSQAPGDKVGDHERQTLAWAVDMTFSLAGNRIRGQSDTSVSLSFILLKV